MNRAMIYYRTIEGKGGIIMGDNTDTRESLINALIEKYGNRLASYE